MEPNGRNAAHPKMEGKCSALIVCWILGNGCLFSWNSMLTIEDYYVHLFPQYHPSRVLTLVYQPCAVATIVILAYREATINTRNRNLFGYSLFFISSLAVLVLDIATSGRGGLGAFIGICLISAVFGVADAHVQGGMVGDLSFMHPDFIQAVEQAKHVTRFSNRELLRQNTDYVIDIFLIYALTLSIFPGFLSEDTGSHSLGTWYALVLISMYNVWDLIGRYIPLVKFAKLESRKGLTAAVFSRFLLIPAFYFTAKYGEQGWMILLTSVLGLTNGYLTVCVLTAAPKGYKGPEQNALGNLLVVFLLAGIFSGVTLDWLWLIGKGW
ncbi:Equilibrative nucleotide transporter 3 [Linum perenne]